MGLYDTFYGGERTTTAETIVGRVGRLGMTAVFAVLVVVGPVLAQVLPTRLNMLVHMLVFALLALSLDFVFGHAGLPSFGHAAMFGTGGYVSALLLSNGTSNLLLVLGISALAGFAVAAAIGAISVRTRGVYFAFLTLAFAQMMYVLVIKDIPAEVLGMDSVTGGSNGIYGLTNYTLFGFGFEETLSMYYLALALLALSFVLVLRLCNSPFGRVLVGLRENEDRINFLGYNVNLYKTVAFAISGALASIAGALWAPYQTIAYPGMLHWTISGEAFIMTLLGGAGTLWGPMLGAALVVFIETTFTGASSGWQLILGGVYVIVVIFSPEGIAGTFQRIRSDDKPIRDRLTHAMRNYLQSVGMLSLVRLVRPSEPEVTTDE